jgi:hypothetical protein
MRNRPVTCSKIQLELVSTSESRYSRNPGVLPDSGRRHLSTVLFHSLFSEQGFVDLIEPAGTHRCGGDHVLLGMDQAKITKAPTPP